MPAKYKFNLDIPPRELQDLTLVRNISANEVIAKEKAESEARLQRQREDYGDNVHNDESDEEELFQTPVTSVAANSMPATNVANSLFPDMPSIDEDDEEDQKFIKKFIEDKIKLLQKELDEKNEFAKPLIEHKNNETITSKDQNILSRLLMDIEKLEKEIKDMNESLSSKKRDNLAPK